MKKQRNEQQRQNRTSMVVVMSSSRRIRYATRTFLLVFLSQLVDSSCRTSPHSSCCSASPYFVRVFVWVWMELIR